MLERPWAVLLIYQLKPKGAVNNWLLAHLRMRFNVLLCQWYMKAAAVAIEVKLAYSYSVAWVNDSDS